MNRAPDNITFCVFFLVISKTVQGIYTTAVSNDSRNLQNILKQRSWYWNGDTFKGTFDQQIFIDQRLNKFINVVGVPLRIHKTNVHRISSVMYTALGCKCGETMIDVLNLLALWIDNGENHKLRFLEPYLIDINKTVLKTISILFHFLDIAPNVVSHEPGVLRTFLSLNLHLNDLTGNYNIKQTETITVTPQIIQKSRNMILQLLNSIERVTISDCSSKIAESDSNVHSRHTTSENIKYSEKIDCILNDFHHLLDNTGLSTLNFYKYNLNVDLFNETPSVEDNFNSNVVGYVLDRFSTVLKSRQNLFKPKFVNRHKNIELIYSYQNSMFDFLLLIVHKNALVYLRKIDSLKNNESSSTFLPNLNPKDENVIKSYRELLFQLEHKKFPSKVVNQIRMIYRVLRNVFFDRPIHDLDMLIKTVENDISAVENNSSFRGNNKGEILKNHTLSEENNFTLHTLLEEIVYVDFVEYFNLIFKLLQNNLQDFNDRAYKDLINIRFDINFTTDEWKCSSVISVYAHCFKIQSAINNNLSKTSSKDLKKKLLTILNILSGIIVYEKFNSGIVSYNLVYAYLYLSYNYINYPGDENTREEILTRTLYALTNLIDRHQLWICENPRNRSSLYGAFDKDSVMLRKELNLKKHELAEYVEGKKLSIFSKNIAHANLDNFVLMENFVRELHRTQPDLKLFWKGVSQSIINALDDTKKNLFNFSIIAKYFKLVVEWTTAVFSYTILDVIDYMLMKKCSKHDSETNNYRFVFDKCPCPGICLSTLNVVIRKMSNLSTYDGQFEDVRFGIINGIKFLLENDVEQFNRIFKSNITLVGKQSLDVKHSKTISNLNAVFEMLTKTQNPPTFPVNFNGQTLPLTYTLINYVNIKLY